MEVKKEKRQRYNRKTKRKLTKLPLVLEQFITDCQ